MRHLLKLLHLILEQTAYPRVVASELQLILEAELEKVMWKYCVGKGSECKTDLQCDGEKKCEYVPIGA